MCIDMNQFFFSHLTADERERVEKLEPFDEFEVKIYYLILSNLFFLMLLFLPTPARGQYMIRGDYVSCVMLPVEIEI